MKSRLTGFALLLLAAIGFGPAPPVATQEPAQSSSAQSAKLRRHGARAIANRYIVVLDQDAAGERGDAAVAGRRAADVLLPLGRVPDFVYGHAINGFAAEMTEAEAAQLAEDPRVLFVEEDSIMETTATQSNPAWGLDRIDQRDLPLSRTYTYAATGAGVNVYIIDTGIRRTHTQFGGRAFAGFDSFGGSTNDCNGHGTHVAGTVGGSTYGVAKAVRLYAVRVLNCSGSGSTSGVIAGVNWVTANHIKPAVANMSLGGGASAALDTAVRNSIAAGVTYAVSAGNSNANAANYSPARVSEAIAVGSSTSSDTRSSSRPARASCRRGARATPRRLR